MDLLEPDQKAAEPFPAAWDSVTERRSPGVIGAVSKADKNGDRHGYAYDVDEPALENHGRDEESQADIYVRGDTLVPYPSGRAGVKPLQQKIE